MNADAKPEYLRMELEACQRRREMLKAEVRGAEVRRETWAILGGVPGPMEDKAAATRAEAFAINARTEATFRQLIAEHLAKHDAQTVQPIRAGNDDAAIFALLGEVGGRMPEGGAR